MLIFQVYLGVLVPLLCCIRNTNTGDPEPPDPPGVVRAVVGDDVILPCFLRHNISAVDLEVMWVADVEKVHLYRRHQDITAQQMAQYRHRTSLFREELHRGNVSLKITNVKRADSNDYHCYVPMNGGYEGTTVHLYVDDLGTNPEMSAQSHVNASVNLTCTSAGWSHRTRPEIKWMNSMGEVLQHIHISKHYVQGQHTFYIKAVATVLQTADDRYTCIVSYLGHKKEREFMVPGGLFKKTRHHFFAAASCACAVIMFQFVMWRLHWVKRKKCAALDRYRRKVCASPAAHYIQLLIARGKRELPDKEELIRTKKGYEPISIEDCFGPDKDHSLVILQGDPGHGKSFTAEKILRDWASKAQYLQHFDLAVSLRCDELSIGSEPRGLLDLLSCRPDDESLTMELMKESPQKILIVIDGIDKIPLSQEDVKSYPSDPFSPAPAAAVLSGLLSRHILPQVFLLVTTTRSASDVEKELCRFHQDFLTAQILGFTEEAVTEYCKSCFGGNTALCTSLVNNSTVFSSCFNPMLCWITCEAMKKQDDLIDTVGTTTSVYLAFFGSFLKHLSLDKKQDLFRQAKKITIEENVLLDLTEIPCLEEGDPFSRSHHNPQGKAFIHQSFPEFFASLSYIEPHVITEDLLTLLNRDFSPGNSPSCHRQNVLKFLFGLSNKNIRSYIPVILGHGGPTQPEMGDPLHHWIKERADSRPWTMQTGLFLMQCLYELRDEDCVKEVMKRMGPMSFIRIPLTYDDVNALMYCLKLCPFIKKLELADCNLTAGKMTLLRDVWNTLDCDELWLTGEGLGCGDIEELIASLKQRVLSSPPTESAKKVVELHFLNGLLLQESDLIRRIAPSLLKVFEGSDITGSVSFKRDSNTPCSDGAWSLFHTKASDNQLTVSVKEPSGAEQGADPEVLSVSLTLQWSSSHLFSTDCHRCLSQHYQPSMVQDICSLPSVKELRMEVTHLTDDWAADLLCSTKPSSWPPDRKFRIVVVNMENSASLEVTALAKGMHRLEYSDSPDKKSVPRDIPTADLSNIDKCKTHLQSLKEGLASSQDCMVHITPSV